MEPLSGNRLKFARFVFVGHLAGINAAGLIAAGIVVAAMEITGGYLGWPEAELRLPDVCYAAGVLSVMAYALHKYSVIKPSMLRWSFLTGPPLLSHTALWVLSVTSGAVLAWVFLFLMASLLVNIYARPLGSLLYDED